MRTTRAWVALLPVVLLATTLAATSHASDTKSDAAAMATIFGDESLGNVLEIHRRGLGLSAENRYALLRDTVFPPRRNVIRIDYEFAPSHVPEAVNQKHEFRDAWSDWRHQRDGARNVRGGELISPLSMLVDAAASVEKLDEILELVQSRTSNSTVVRNGLAVQLLVAIAKGDLEAAQEILHRFDTLISANTISDEHLGAETVVLWNATFVPELQNQANDLANRFYQEIAAGGAIQSETWRRHLFALTYLLQWHQHHPDGVANQAESRVPERWHPISRTSSESNGNGYPLALWHFESGRTESITGHDHDYLYYDVPLSGNFSVEGDVSPFAHGDMRLGFGGIWAGPGYDHRSILNGNFAADRPTIPLDPKLDEVGETIRFRLDIENGTRTTLINGRPVFHNTPSSSDPWLSIFSFWYTHGWARNLRIVGDVEVPEVIDLALSPDMVGWSDYFAAQGTDWRRSESNDSPVLSSPRHPELAGCFHESLYQYHRPMLEDGTISYEFYYEEGKVCVSPALDRCVFVLDPSGAHTHIVTNGRYDRIARRPDNQTGESNHLIADQLVNQAWNHLELQTIGDSVRVRLNDSIVFEQPLSESNSRTFGLFHYSDQTEARVRNLRWRGDWPRSIPSALKQVLARQDVESLLSTESLVQSFEHNFAAGTGRDKFQEWGSGISSLPQGTQVIRTSDGNHAQSVISPQIQLAGDFDIAAKFEGFDAEIANGGDSNIHLLIGFEEESTECFLYRKFTRYAKPDGQQVIQAAYFHTREGERLYHFPAITSEASSTGTLKLSRRGKQLHYLYAADNSSHFRLLHTESVPTGQTKRGGLRLISETTRAGRVATTWKSIAIQAERVSGLASEPSMSVPQLDASREKLAANLEVDFSNPQSSSLYRLYGRESKFTRGENGLTIAAPGFKNWEGHFVSMNTGLIGDFDIALDLTVEQLADPDPGGESVVLIQAEIPDANKTYVETKFARSDDGETGGEVQIRNLNGDGGFEYKELVRIPINDVSQLRLARRDGMAYFLVQENGSSKPKLLGRLKFGMLPINPGFLRVIVHTGGEGKQSKVLVKKLTLHAQQVLSPQVRRSSTE